MIEMIRRFLINRPWSVIEQESPQVVRIQRTFDSGTDVVFEVRQLSSGQFQIEQSIEHRLSGPYNHCLPLCDDLVQMQDILANRIEELDAEFDN